MPSFEFLHNGTLGQMLVNMRPMSIESCLRLSRRDLSILDEPANDDGRTASSTGFAMDVNLFAGSNLFIHKLDCFFDILD